MQTAIARLKGTRDERAEMNLPLTDTLAHISAAEDELRLLETELGSLQATLPRKERQLNNLEKEIKVHETKKEELEQFASEAVRAREGARAAGKADRETTGQWYKSSYEVLSAMLDEK
jgi:chromosome segregation ATPase